MSKEKSTSMLGREFEERVEILFRRIADRVEAERILGHKKIDLCIERTELGKRRIYAVECKNLQSALDISQLKVIAVDYNELVTTNLIDGVVLVTRNGLTAAAEAFIQNSKSIFHLTIDQLQSMVMDFRDYLTTLVSEYEHDGFHRYYVPTIAKIVESELEVEMDRLFGDEDSDAPNDPVAILGGYGTGKTTFLRTIAYHYAKRFLKDGLGRVPIYIPLGEICTEQTLEGLLGARFSAAYSVRGYNYGLFQELNRAGAFIILLDGFDEMKQNTKEDTFRYNFNQIIRLTSKKSKLVLSGRQSAFLTASERAEFLSATLLRQGTVYAIPEKPRFIEHELCFLDDNRIRSFIGKYRSFLVEEKGLASSDLPLEEEFFSTASLRDICQRPVQLQMLFQVLPHYKGDLNDLTVRELYFYFIDLLIQREASKPSRRQFSASQRRNFIDAIAWYFWFKKQNQISVNDLPIREFLMSEGREESANEDSLRRDLVTGSCLDIRYPDVVTFSHRSILEFLVAEFISSALGREGSMATFATAIGAPVTLATLDTEISPEIFEFFISQLGDNDRQRLAELFLQSPAARGQRFFDIWLQSDSWIAQYQSSTTFTLLDLVLIALDCSSKTPRLSDVRSKAVESAVQLLVTGPDVLPQSSYYQTLHLALIISASAPDREERWSLLSACCQAIYDFNPENFRSSRGSALSDVPNYIRRLRDCIGFHAASGEFQIWQLSDKLPKGGFVGIMAWYDTFREYVPSNFPPRGQLKDRILSV